MNKIVRILIFVFLVSGSRGMAIDTKFILTSDQNIGDKWNKTISGHEPEFSVVDDVCEKQYFTLLLLFSNFETNGQGIANVVFDLKIICPDKTIYFERKGFEGFRKKISNPEFVHISHSLPSVCFEPGDQKGMYEMEVTVRDLISMQSIKKRTIIKLVDFDNRKYFSDDDSLNSWIGAYYKSPSPLKAIDGFLYFANNEISNKTGVSAPLFAFFEEVFSRNLFLIPYLKKVYPEQSLKGKTYILRLFHSLKVDKRLFFDTLPENEKTLFSKLSKSRPMVQKTAILTPSDLDVQWALFSASGTLATVRKIVSGLIFREFNDAVEVYNKNPDNKSLRRDAIKGSIYRASKWSLERNCKIHPLVEQYASFLLKDSTLSANEKIELDIILKNIK